MNNDSLDNPDRVLYCETGLISFGNINYDSKHEATPEEIKLEQGRHANGECRHEVFYEVKGFPNHSRYCGVCDSFLGFA